MSKDEIKNRIRDKVIELARELGNEAVSIEDDDIIPATGLLDSASILGLVVWYEDAFDMPLKQEEINIDRICDGIRTTFREEFDNDKQTRRSKGAKNWKRRKMVKVKNRMLNYLAALPGTDKLSLEDLNIGC